MKSLMLGGNGEIQMFVQILWVIRMTAQMVMEIIQMALLMMIVHHLAATRISMLASGEF